MNPELSVTLAAGATASSNQVGGKASSLMRLIEADHRVPPGFVLTASYFEPWFAELKATTEWQRLRESEPDAWHRICPRLKDLARHVDFSTSQRRSLSHRLDAFDEAGTEAGAGGPFAVRSSSPEEDLVAASFAGGYETVLGVQPADLDDAIRACFASSLDARVLVYKQQHGFDPLEPSIAVIIQQQIAAEVAGVGFSIDPLTNDYDEAVIDANWGLGESVVAGVASPDHFVVDKTTGQVIERQLGDKQVSIWLRPDGGTIERRDHRSDESTLDDAQFAELVTAMIEIESLYGQPVDIEWAFADGQLYLLQARPITTWVPLPPELLTEPGKRRRLYADAALAGGLTINAPISPLGLDWMRRSIQVLTRTFVGDIKPKLGADQALWLFAGCRMYQNVSNLLTIVSPKQLAKGTRESDELMASIFAAIDRKRYRAATRPYWLRARMLRYLPGLLRHMLPCAWFALRVLISPQRTWHDYRQRSDAFDAELRNALNRNDSATEFEARMAPMVIEHLFNVQMASILGSLVARGLLDRLVPKRLRDGDLDQRLKIGFEGNEVVAMGIELFELAQRFGADLLRDPEHLAEQLDQRQLPQPLLEAWGAFIANYGWRGPLEMDIASPGYADEPALAVQQMASLPIDDPAYDPGAAHRRLVESRHAALETVLEHSGPLRRRLIRHLHRVVDRFTGTRDTPKHQNLMFYAGIRSRLLAQGEQLAAAGRLDLADDIFDLTFDDLELAERDPSADLRQRANSNTQFLDKLRAHVRNFPSVIDSRGRILRPAPSAERPGELTGMPVSSGTAIGPVRILHSPDAKAIEPGDVLVAYLTDPGWTPLFANAAAIVLEVGGMLQHGAVVAREYGKPCVVGIDRVTSRLEDGQAVEVDGSTGIVRLMPEAEGA